MNHVEFWRHRLETLGPQGTVGETVGGALNLLEGACRRVLFKETHVMDRVLDVGCGLGFLLPLMPEWIRSYHGVDLLPELVEEASKRHTKSFVTFSVLDLLDIQSLRQIPTEEYSVVVGHSIMFSLIQHTTGEMLDQICAELCRIGNKAVLFSCYGGKTEGVAITMRNGALERREIR